MMQAAACKCSAVGTPKLVQNQRQQNETLSIASGFVPINFSSPATNKSKCHETRIHGFMLISQFEQKRVFSHPKKGKNDLC